MRRWRVESGGWRGKAAGFTVLAAVTLYALPSTLFAADTDAPSVQAEVAPTTAKLGDVLTLTIRVRHPNGIKVSPPTFSKSLGTFEVRSSSAAEPEPDGVQWLELYRAELQNFTTGQQPLPGIQLDYVETSGKKAQLKTPDLKVDIQDIPPGPKDKGDIRGIKGVIGPTAWSPWWWVLLAALLVGGGFVLWRKRQQVIQGPPPPPPVPPDEMALKKLQTLKEGDWLTTGRIKEYYIALSDIVRGYLESGFKVPALERTTTELMRSVQKQNVFQPAQQIDIRNLLEECDLVKFAKFRPEAAEASKAHTMAHSIVEQTRGALRERREEK